MDSNALEGIWSGKTDLISWCVEFTEDMMYRRVEYSQYVGSIGYYVGVYELQRGKRVLITMDSTSDKEYGNWAYQEDTYGKRRDLFIVAELSNTTQTVRTLVMHPEWKAGVDSVSERVENCDAKIKEFESLAETFPRVTPAA